MLTRKESQLLEALRGNPGRCLSRSLLLALIWGYREGIRSRTVDEHVLRLRKKLGDEGRERIKTVLGCGYMWAVPGAAGDRTFR